MLLAVVLLLMQDIFGGKALTAFDLNYELNDKSIVANLGLEYYLVENFALRAGFLNDPSGELSYTTLGVGADLGTIGFDLSYMMGDNLDPHSDMVRFSLSGSFQKNNSSN